MPVFVFKGILPQIYQMINFAVKFDEKDELRQGNYTSAGP